MHNRMAVDWFISWIIPKPRKGDFKYLLFNTILKVGKGDLQILPCVQHTGYILNVSSSLSGNIV